MDFEPIFNKLTVDSFNKFIEKYGLTIKKGKTKSAYQNNLKDLFSNNDDIKNNFIWIQKRLEESIFIFIKQI